MPLPFDFHLEDCKPTKPCNNCELTKLVKSAFHTPELMEQVRTHLDGIAAARKTAGEDETMFLTKHLPGCTPDKPCEVCQAVNYLQGRPGDTAKIFKLLDPPIKTPATEE